MTNASLPSVLVLLGQRRSGKDEFFNTMKDLVKDRPVVRFAFADFLKNTAARIILGIMGGELSPTSRELACEVARQEELRKAGKLGPRAMWDALGYWYREEISEDFFIKKFIAYMEGICDPKTLVVVTDARAWQEIDMLHDRYDAQFLLVEREPVSGENALNFIMRFKDYQCAATADRALELRTYERSLWAKDIYEFAARQAGIARCAIREFRGLARHNISPFWHQFADDNHYVINHGKLEDFQQNIKNWYEEYGRHI